MIGNLLEAYDVSISSFLATTLATTFFPANAQFVNIINTFYILLIGYLARPFGSLFVGLYADFIGRKKMLIVSIILLGISTCLIGLIPPYNFSGVFSAIFFLLFRLIQNFFAGGEFISSISYLIESDDQQKKGYFGSWSAFGLNTGALLGSLIVFLVTYFIEIKVIPSWSWRLAFLLALVGMVFGFWLRNSIPESIEFVLNHQIPTTKTKTQLIRESLNFLKFNLSKCIGVIGVNWLGVCVTYSFYIYAPIHMASVNHLTKYESFGINSIGLATAVLLIPFFGYISDKISKISLICFASTLYMFLSFPYFWVISYGNFFSILIFHIVISVPAACLFSINPVLTAETFPIEIRCTSMALVYQTITSIAAGTIPIILLTLVHSTKINYSPSYLIMISAILGYFALFLGKKDQFKSFNLFIIESEHP